MPTRYLKPGIRDSEAIDRLSPLAEVLFYRLIVTVDDFGRTDARPAMVKAACFPIRETVGALKCAELLAEIADAGLVDLYEVDGKPFLQMRKWDNAPRAKESKFPPPAGDCMHVHADACKPRTVLPETETETGTDNRNRKPEPTTEDGEIERHFADAWAAYPKRPGASRADSLKAYRARIKAGADPLQILAGVRAYAAFCTAMQTEPQFIKQPATFFGPGNHFLADWTPRQGLPAGRAGDRSRVASEIRRLSDEADGKHHDDSTLTIDGETGRPV